MAKHTEGPWNEHEHYPISSDPLRVPKEDGGYECWHGTVACGDKIIAQTISSKSKTTGFPHVSDFDEARANTRLMIAAPEMLAALKDVRDFLKRSGYDIALVDAVVKKAEGRAC